MSVLHCSTLHLQYSTEQKITHKSHTLLSKTTFLFMLEVLTNLKQLGQNQ